MYTEGTNDGTNDGQNERKTESPPVFTMFTLAEITIKICLDIK